MVTDPKEVSWNHHSYMMMPQLLSGKPGNSIPVYARPTISPPQLPTSPALMNQDPQQTLHPVILIFQKQELGRHFLVLTIPMIIALVSLFNPVHAPIVFRLTAIALSVGVAAIWNGILLRETCPRASKWIELFGVALVLLSFYGFVGCALPDKTLIWIPALCWLLNLLPFAIAYCSRERVLENGNLPLQH
ncbi:hypothetical protein Patl1_16610 [Pistacia atlantica]|uniref:Uncharacterized protein n=1 Tax=Pistacia atlantica TaxID=434234 RepID=A0ACC1B8K2_9ROSI|nr:hypothetical protein Patl1_16610 [Pistacia atlantica]